jgi:hypothetical protein
MRLYELQSEPPVKAVLRDYIKKGYTRIGEPSASAVVFASPDLKQVVKVGKRSDCWLNFAEEAINSDNPHLPRISKLEAYGPHYLAVIEYLQEMPPNFHRNPIYKHIAAWLYLRGGWQNGKDVFLSRMAPESIEALAAQLEAEKPLMVEALAMIVRARGGCNYDCYPENLMQRSDGTIVFSDPLTHQG